MIAAAIFTAPVGWLSARFGRKRFFIVALVGFTLTSMACGLAQNLPQEVVFRFLQGCFGAALVPLSQAIMLDPYPIEKRSSVMAIWATGRMIGVLASSIQPLHAQYAEQITPFNRALQSGATGLFLGPATPFGAPAAEAQVQYHAMVAAYANDFLLMFWICVPLLPLLFFMKKPCQTPPSAAELAVE